MKKILLLTAAILAGCIIASLNYNRNIVEAQTIATTTLVATTSEESKVYVPTHAQNVWLHALEWCESGGNRSSINPKDKDGTPSYYSFQFKPSTFKYLSIKYKILEPSKLDTKEELMVELKNYDNQYNVVASMIQDKSTKWRTQFPGCVAKLGLPPKY